MINDELKRYDIAICGLAETYWKSFRYFQTDDYTVYYSGPEVASRNGEAVLVSRKFQDLLKQYQIVSNRIISVTLEDKPTMIDDRYIYAYNQRH